MPEDNLDSTLESDRDVALINERTYLIPKEGGTPNTKHKHVLLLSVYCNVFLYFLAYYQVPIVDAQYITDYLLAQYNETNDNTVHLECIWHNQSTNMAIMKDVQSKASLWMIPIQGSRLVSQFFITFLMGAYSDVMGRKIALTLPPIGGVIRSILSVCVVYYQLPLWCLVASSFIEGVFGCAPLVYTGTYTAVGDVTSSNRLPFFLCIADALSVLTLTVSSIGAGYIISAFNYTVMYAVFAAVYMVELIFLFLCVPESKPVEALVAKPTLLQHFQRGFKVYAKDDGSNRRWKLWFLLVISCLFNIANIGNSDVMTYTVLDYPLCFTSIQVGFYFSVLNIWDAIGGLLFAKLSWSGVSEGKLLIVTILSFILFPLLITLAHTQLAAYLASLTVFAEAMPQPLVGALMSPLASASEQGAMFAVYTWLGELSTLVAQVQQNAIYASTVTTWFGTVYVINAGISAVNGCLIVSLLYFWKREERQKYTPIN